MIAAQLYRHTTGPGIARCVPNSMHGMALLATGAMGATARTNGASTSVLSEGERLNDVRPRRPNILTILADDLGTGDVPSFSPDTAPVPIPAIDSLASNGVRFTDFHTTPLCSPSRYAFLSGNFPNRGKKWSGMWNLKYQHQFKDGQLSIAHALAEVGYRTAMFGKFGIGLTVDGDSALACACEHQNLKCTTNWLLSNLSSIDVGYGPPHLGFETSFISSNGIQSMPYGFWQSHEINGKLYPLHPATTTCWGEGVHLNANGFSSTGCEVGCAQRAATPEVQERRTTVQQLGGDQSECNLDGMSYWASNNYDLNTSSRRAAHHQPCATRYLTPVRLPVCYAPA